MPPEPQSATDYNDRTTTAVKSVLLEIGQILGSFQGKFVVIGGSVPWLLLDNNDMPHIGTLDVDLSLDAEALGNNEYITLIEALFSKGYQQRKDLRRFQLVRTLTDDDGGTLDVIVDFLMPRTAKFVKNKPPMIDNFAVQKADGAGLALRFYDLVQIEGVMPGGGRNTVKIAVASIPALLAMKGFALHGRLKQKDAYDIYYCVLNFPGGVEALADACRPLLGVPEGNQGYRLISEKFRSVDDYGPTSVRRFVVGSQILGERTAEQWQRDAFGQVDALLRALGIHDGISL